MAVLRVPAAIDGVWAGGPGVNVWSIRTTGLFPPFDELDAALTALKTFYTSIAGLLRQGVKVHIGQDIVERDTAVDASRPVQEIASTGGTSLAPPSLQMCISWKTSLRARRAMGRTFIGPLNGTVIESDGTITSTALTTLTNAVTALKADSDTANGWALGVWGLESPGVYDSRGVLEPGQPHVHRDVTSFKIRDQFAILRSRRD